MSDNLNKQLSNQKENWKEKKVRVLRVWHAVNRKKFRTDHFWTWFLKMNELDLNIKIYFYYVYFNILTS